MPYKFNPFTGNLDFFKKNNFSYETISSGYQIQIPVDQQMIVYKDITVDGTLVVDGELVIDDFVEKPTCVSTLRTETINANIFDLIIQTASGITTSLSNVVQGTEITITNRSGGTNTLNLTIQGTASPSIYDKESLSLFYNGVDYELT